MKIRVATRGSKLALLQTNEVTSVLNSKGHRTETMIVKSHGDSDTSTPLHKIGVRGIFEKEVDKAVLTGEADLAVHSLKDVPFELPAGLVLAATPKRSSPYDAILPKPLYKLKIGDKVATGSLRREATVKLLRPDLNTVGIRGNIDTRINKLHSGYSDALIAAEAAFIRMKITGWRRLNPKYFVPSPGQGALGITCRSNVLPPLQKVLAAVNHQKTFLEVNLERAVASKIGAGCTSPLGVLARAESNGAVHLIFSLARTNYTGRIFFTLDANKTDAVSKAVAVFKRLDGEAVIQEWRAWSREVSETF
jgi:hydroxymethylbilane synthase